VIQLSLDPAAAIDMAAVFFCSTDTDPDRVASYSACINDLKGAIAERCNHCRGGSGDER